jgi:hypothetical protein
MGIRCFQRSIFSLFLITMLRACHSSRAIGSLSLTRQKNTTTIYRRPTSRVTFALRACRDRFGTLPWRLVRFLLDGLIDNEVCNAQHRAHQGGLDEYRAANRSASGSEKKAVSSTICLLGRESRTIGRAAGSSKQRSAWRCTRTQKPPGCITGATTTSA